MKFDFCIGNPPYQEEAVGDKLSDVPVYHYFLNAGQSIADKVEMIHPARFLFNAGATPKDWNKKMLEDEHFKVLDYRVKSNEVFPNTDVKGGIAITYYDNDKDFGAIHTFSAYKEITSILKKVKSMSLTYMDSIVYSAESYKFTEQLYQDYPEIEKFVSKGHKYDITSNIFDKLINKIFFMNKPSDGEKYIQIYGRLKGKRTLLWVDHLYVVNENNFNVYKIFIPAANGSGAIGEVVSTPVIGIPIVGMSNVAHNQTFISIGKFETQFEADACLKYIKSKFARLLLGTLKVTQNGKKAVYANIPMQDFSDKSDIDWTKPIDIVDLQLYKKYKLSDDEISFIENHVKSMGDDLGMEKNYKEIVGSIINLNDNIFKFTNSRNAVHRLVNLDVDVLEKIKWRPKSIATKSFNFRFELDDGVVNEYYDRNFNYDEYFEKNRGYSLPVKLFDFSIVVKIEEYPYLKFKKIAKIGLRYSDVFYGVVSAKFTDKDKRDFCLVCFESLFARLLRSNKYLSDKKDSIDIGIIIIDVLEQLSDEVKRGM